MLYKPYSSSKSSASRSDILTILTRSQRCCFPPALSANVKPSCKTLSVIAFKKKRFAHGLEVSVLPMGLKSASCPWA
ncbi:unnamed protein product [Lasius platythorax]|uniref:Uncharacterized protein n=1 Tax=Lasius platythorax TaxID=488582 RepID=A0AAV2MY59_9HYME